MDLHNNKVGRSIFNKGIFENINEIINVIKLELDTAIKISSVEEIEKYTDILIYIKEE